MKEVYSHLNSLNNYEGVVEIEGRRYRVSKTFNYRISEIPEVGSWTNIGFCTWLIRPDKNIILRIERI